MFIDPPNQYSFEQIPDKSMVDKSFDDTFSIIHVIPYEAYETEKLNSIIYDYNWNHFMRLWTGYNPQLLPQDDFESLPEVAAMPAYPDDGSIKVINETVVVKF